MNQTTPSAAERRETTGSATAEPQVIGATTDQAPHSQSVDHDAPVPPGRPVRLQPTPPGLWRVLLGSVVALLSPFFGVLIGSGWGAGDMASRMDPLYWGFFIGGLIGAGGLVVAGLGAMALMRYSKAKGDEEP